MQGCFHGPWLFVGDFHAVLGAHEKRGLNPPLCASCLDFAHWSNANLLTHLPTSGPLYTWHNSRLGTENVALRLDRSICNEDWTCFWCLSSYSALVLHQSNHHPFLLSLNVNVVKHVVPFKNFKTWTEHEDCRRLVSYNWSRNVIGSGMVHLQLKLKNLKLIFKTWNQTVFGDVDRQVRLALDEVSRIQNLIDFEGLLDALYA